MLETKGWLHFCVARDVDPWSLIHFHKHYTDGFNIMQLRYILTRQGHHHASLDNAVSETVPLLLQGHKSGTVRHPILDYMGCHMASSGGYWKHFYSDSEATVQCELFLTVLDRNILTYLRVTLSPTMQKPWRRLSSLSTSCFLRVSCKAHISKWNQIALRT